MTWPRLVEELDASPPYRTRCAFRAIRRVMSGVLDSVVDRPWQLHVVYLDQEHNLELVERWIVEDVLEGYFGRGWRAAE